jgi:hypothetical protein
MTKPAYFLFGDSHSIPLARGLEAHGIPFVHLTTPNPSWHAGLVVEDHFTGIKLLNPSEAGRVEKAQDALGVTDLTDPKIPMICSFAMSTGMLSPIFWDFPHEPAWETAKPGDLSEALRVRRFSSAFMRDYVDATHGYKTRFAQRFSRNTDVIMVVQPRNTHWKRRYVLEKLIWQDMLDLGITVYDPSLNIGDSETYAIPAELMDDVGVHGNNTFGKRAVEDMIEMGLLKFDTEMSVS